MRARKLDGDPGDCWLWERCQGDCEKGAPMRKNNTRFRTPVQLPRGKGLEPSERSVRVCPYKQPWHRERMAFQLWVAYRQYRVPPFPGSLMEQDPWIDEALRICEAEQGLIDEFIRAEQAKLAATG